MEIRKGVVDINDGFGEASRIAELRADGEMAPAEADKVEGNVDRLKIFL